MKTLSLKILSILLTLVLVTGVICAVPSYAHDDEYEIDGDQYLSDICLKLAKGEQVDFEDRYVEYDLLVIAKMNQSNDGDSQTRFASEYDYSAHQRICADALRIMAHDLGNSRYNSTISGQSINDLLITNSAEPDKSEKGDYKEVNEDGTLKYSSLNILHPFSNFCGHFYNPYTELNNVDSNDNTAKINARRHYDAAVNLYGRGEYIKAFTELGKGLHYVQDACECHHAAGEDAIDSGNNHSEFETMIDNAIQATTDWTLIGDLPSGEDYFDASVYNEALKTTVENIVRNNGYSSYPLCDRSKSYDCEDADDVIFATYKNATTAAVQYFYKFAKQVGMSFT